MNALWQLPIIEGPIPWIIYALAVAVALFLLIRRPTRLWVLTALIGILAGALVGVSAYLIANATNAFGDALPLEVAIWAGVAFAGIGLAVVNLWRSPWWRKLIAIIGVVVFALTATVGINAFYGLNRTLGSLFGIVAGGEVVIPTPGPTPGPTQTNAGPLYQSWTPPAGMPETGQQGTQVIPGTQSGFQARPAGIYLPPAALVPNAPALPLVIMMMGFPGNPDPSYIGDVLDTLAAQNKGLAPIAIVADQIGSADDPACADSTAHGNAETYIKTDVVAWAKANLNILQDPKYWVIAGYSNGGGCAIKYGAQEPTVWKNILDISGEEYPGSEDEAGVVAQVYNGDQSAFDAVKPVNILQANTGQYAGVNAIFTVGGNDPTFIPAAQTVSAAAKAAGMATTYYVVPGAGHVVDGLNGGLTQGFTLLYPILELSPP